MMRYWAQPADRIYVKGCGFLSFAKNTGKNLGTNKNKNFFRHVSYGSETS